MKCREFLGEACVVAAELAVQVIALAVAAVLAYTLIHQAMPSSFGQEPDRRGEAWIDPPAVYKGDRPNAPIPPELHIQNEGGSDGAGLCVISSILCNGRYQKVPGLEGGKGSQLWKTAKGRPGGYSPDKLSALVNKVMPDERYASYYGRDTSVLEKLSAQGYPIGATMNTGKLYHYMPIHHMISLISYKKDGYAWVVDNNRPGHYSVMPAAEFDRRWFDGGYGWAWVWTRLPASVRKAISLVGPLAILCAAIAGLIVRQKRAGQPAGA